jgi:dephospho-CoA kinase
MLRVGITGGLGSGKSTAAALFQALGAHILSSDDIGRALMQPGESVFAAIVKTFGSSVVLSDGRLDRPVLAKIAFAGGRIDDLNAIVLPAVIARQGERADVIAAREPNAVVIIESALIFETKYGGDGSWRHRFDKLILVTAPEELKVARFVARSSIGRVISSEQRSTLEAEAYRRIAQQIPDEQKTALCDYVLTNSGQLKELEWQVDQLWPLLLSAACS